MGKVSTPWIFHLEDDFFFIAPHFIEESLEAHRFLADKLPEGQKLWQLWLYAYSFSNKLPDPQAFKAHIRKHPDWETNVIKTHTDWINPADHSSHSCTPREKSYYRVQNTSQKGWTIYTGLRKTEDVMLAYPWAEAPVPDNVPENSVWKNSSGSPNHEFPVAKIYFEQGYVGYWLKDTNWMINRGADYKMTKLP